MKNSRINREKKTVNNMIGMFCQQYHSPDNQICEDCESLVQYSNARLENCVFRKNKPVCSKCPVHCYKPEKREKIRTVMRFAGPRMICRHPYLAVMYLVDKARSAN